MTISAITQREILSIIFRSKRYFILMFFCAALPVAIFPYLLTHLYAATASILINSGPEFETTTDPGAQGSEAPYLTKQEIINSELAILASHDLAVETIDAVGLSKIYPSIAAHPPSSMSPMDAAVRKFSKDFTAVPVTMSEVINLNFDNPNRDVARQTLATLIEIYQNKHSTIFGDTEAPQLRAQLDQYETQLDALTLQIAQLREQKSLFNVDGQTTQAIYDRSEIVDVLQSLQAKSADAHERIQYYRKRLTMLPALVEAGQTQSTSVDAAKSNLLDLQLQLQKLHQRYNGDVKPVQDAEAQIATVQNFIAGRSIATDNTWMERNPAYDDAILKLQQSEADASSLDAQIVLQQQDLVSLDAQLNNLIEGGRDLEALERNHAMLNDLAMKARDRYEDAKSSGDLDQQNIGSVNIISSADASSKYVKPRHIPFILAGIAFGLIADALLLLYLASWKETLLTSESVERLLGVKVLGSISYGASAARG
jgi:uncharacterized protein involved in exopolysaccharide biosynthesis